MNVGLNTIMSGVNISNSKEVHDTHFFSGAWRTMFRNKEVVKPTWCQTIEGEHKAERITEKFSNLSSKGLPRSLMKCIN